MASTYLINDCSCPLGALVDSFNASLFSRYSIGLAWEGYVRYLYSHPSSHRGGLFNGSLPTKNHRAKGELILLDKLLLPSQGFAKHI